MTKVPPKATTTGPSRTLQPQRTDRSRRPRQTERPERQKPQVSGNQGPSQHVEEGEGISNEQHEPELTHEEMQEQQAEKGAEGWVADKKADDREEKVARDDEVAKTEREEQAKDAPRQPGGKEGMKQQPGKQSAAFKKVSDGFERGASELAKAQHLGSPDKPQATNPAIKAQALGTPALPPPRPGKPADAMTLLHSAKDHGVFFVEDSEREGHSEEKEDPELAAAVEECIRLLFGVRGIHRIGPGTNEAGEPVVIVVATRGFGEAAMKAVPDKVHRFPTLLALPYDMLPLRRER